MADFVLLMGASFIATIGLMTILWLVYLIRKNAGIVDLGWCVSFLLVGSIYLYLGQGFWVRKWVLAGMIFIWAGRLLSYLMNRYIHTEEDPRYVQIREAWGSQHSNAKFLLLYWFQGLLVVILSICFLIAFRDPNPYWYPMQTWGLLFWLLGVGGEALADYQLETFKKDPLNNARVCNKGLWNYSRHPNYFFEWITWIGFCLYGWSSPFGIFTLISPIIMLILLVRISGIPLTEAHLLKTKGDAYRDYQNTTSSFIPWIKMR